MSTNNTIPVVESWIGGKLSHSKETNYVPIYNPATGSHIKNLALGTESDAAAAISAAATAGTAWSALSIAKRQAVLFRFRELLNSRAEDLAQLITEEHGKVLSDAVGEIKRGLEVVDLACGFPSFVSGGFSENVSTGVDVHTIKQAVGVVAIISPFNFPAMVPMWFFPIAIAVGNSVILKPSEKDPSAALWLGALWQEAGLPDGVFNVLQGDKRVVDALLQAPEVQAISFVGSTNIARYIYSEAAKRGKRVQALGGANNHMVVLPDADLDLVADQAINSGYGSAGERCMAQAEIIVVDPESGSTANLLVKKIAERIERLRVGEGTAEVDMGPLITAEHRARVSSYIDIAEADGADIVVDGRGLSVPGYQDGFWLGPTLIDNLPLTSRSYTEEIFGPVLGVIRVKSLDEAISLINSGVYGNGTAIFTNDGTMARQFQHEVEVGMIGVNVPIPVPVAYHSFGGWRESLFGSAKAYGPAGFEFFTREKAVTTRWTAAPSKPAKGLEFPSAAGE